MSRQHHLQRPGQHQLAVQVVVVQAGRADHAAGAANDHRRGRAQPLELKVQVQPFAVDDQRIVAVQVAVDVGRADQFKLAGVAVGQCALGAGVGEPAIAGLGMDPDIVDLDLVAVRESGASGVR